MPPANTTAARPLTRSDYKTLSLSALGGALEFYDFIIFVFFATVVGKLFFPADMPEWLRQLQTFGLFAAGYLARPLGGIVMAHFGDLLGRKKMFTLSIFLMSVPTLLMGVLPTYEQMMRTPNGQSILVKSADGAALVSVGPSYGEWLRYDDIPVTMREAIQLILRIAERNPALMPLPFGLAKLKAAFLQFAPGDLKLTPDQVELLKSDNVVSEAAKSAGLTLEGLGITPESMAAVLPSYLWRFRKTGQFAHKNA